MEDVIQLLPDSIANQIAAGEVVQRPASVVKELMENAVDAGASKVTVVIKEAGKISIQVIDDGIGMSETDARLSLERHATSKIRETEDLFKIRTMGFRGEALASIAAVSQMEVKTRHQESEIGTLIRVEASEVVNQEPAACASGTSVAVKNLFYNIPARRNFLKSNGVEMRHIIEEFQRVALASPDVAFQLFQNDLESYNLPASKLSQRIVHLFGKNYQSHLASVDENTSHLTVQGYIGKPDSAKRTRGEQFFFANGRYIRSNYLNHAVQSAYEGLIAKDQYPFYVLNLVIDPAHIDVNVHPTKTEIKFMDERTVYGVLHSAVKQALGAHNLSPSLDFDTDVNFGKGAPGSFESIKERDYGRFRTASPEEIDKWDKLYEELLRRKEESPLGGEDGGSTDKLNFRSAANTTEGTDETDGEGEISRGPEDSSFILHNRFIVSQIKSGMIIIDIRRARERTLFERFMKQLQDKRGLSQRLLFPVTVDLNPADVSLLKDMGEEIRLLGFELEEFGKNTVVVNGVPAEIEGVEDARLLEGLLEQYKANKERISVPAEEGLARALAKRSTSKLSLAQSKIELNAIIDNLFACENPNYTPDGEPTFFVLDLDRIESFFNN